MISDITAERLAVLRKADLIVQQEVRESGLHKELWQAFAATAVSLTVFHTNEQRNPLTVEVELKATRRGRRERHEARR